MGRISCETESPISPTNDDASMRFDRSIDEQWPFVSQTSMKDSSTRKGLSRSGSKLKKKNSVLLEGYVEGNGDENDLGRTKSLTDDDLDELKGCVDLGFGFSYDEIPELCSTLPALELCYSMSQKFGDDNQKSPDRSSESTDSASESTASPIASWRISGPGDHPEDVKARLKFWAQAVACTVRLCN